MKSSSQGAASDASMTLATQCALAFSTEGSLTPIVARHARELALRIDAALEQARREAVEECAKLVEKIGCIAFEGREDAGVSFVKPWVRAEFAKKIRALAPEANDGK